MLHLLAAARDAGAVLLVSNALIICHELGHYWTARAAGVRARRFAIGFGPALVRKFDRRGTEWTLSMLPLGGYVAFEGERDVSCPDGYAARAPLTRIAIIAAGPAANVLVAILIFAIMLGTIGQAGFLPKADAITPGSAAARAGFQTGDRIVTMNGTPVHVFEDLRPTLRAGAGKTVQFQVVRNGQILDLFAELGATEQGGRRVGFLGIRSTSPTHITLPPGKALVQATEKTWHTITDTIDGVTTLVTTGQGAENVAGIVGVAQLTGQAAQQGLAFLLALVAILSANIALMNLLPIPVLDGGAILLCLVEWAIRKPVPEHVQAFGAQAGARPDHRLHADHDPRSRRNRRVALARTTLVVPSMTRTLRSTYDEMRPQIDVHTRNHT